MRHNALVTAIGTVTATAIVLELKRSGNYYIFGADINQKNEIATSLDVDEFYQFPVAANEDYLPFVLDFCRENHIEYYFAVIDKEVVNLAKNRREFSQIGTKLCVVNEEFAHVCHYKDIFGNWIAENMPSIAIKTYDTFESVQKARYPLFIKPVEGVASAGCRKIMSPEELAAAIKPEEFGKKFIIQDFVAGINITVDCIRNRKTGQKAQIQRRELLRNSNGCGIAVEIFRDDELTGICDELMEKLDLNGVVNMEFFETESGYKIIEINPRFSAGTEYSCMAGINTVENAVRIVDGEPCIFGELAVGAHFAERYVAYRMD